MHRVAILIDGGHVRVAARKADYIYDPDFIELFAKECIQGDEDLLRVLYYDCAPYEGKVPLPISGGSHEFKGSDSWLRQLAAKDLIAVRRGVLKFRGWVPKTVPLPPKAAKDSDFSPNFEQKGVDMRIGLDVATYAANKAVSRLILVTGDTDCCPAMKHARIAGLQIVLICLPGSNVASELKWHSDFVRAVKWPSSAKKAAPKKSASGP